MIVGQLGGGLGSRPTTTPSPDRMRAQGSYRGTRPAIGGCTQTARTGAAGVLPPAQAPRVQSFATEVAARRQPSAARSDPDRPANPGTYLIESGTHPSIQGPMGLYGMLVVTTRGRPPGPLSRREPA